MTATFPRWLWASTWGWWLGIVLVTALAIAADSIGVEHAQVPVGVGMGLGVGLAQWLALRRAGGSAAGWLRATLLGVTAPFVLADLARLVGLGDTYALYAAAALAGIAAGVLQARTWRLRGSACALWIVAGTAAWIVASGTVAAADAIWQARAVDGRLGLALYLGLLFGGGVPLGVVTGWAARRLAHPRTAAA